MFLPLYWTAFFPLKREARKGGSFDWGWLWVLVWEILQAAEVNLKHTLLPDSCTGVEVSSQRVLSEGDKQWWRRQCSPQVVGVPETFVLSPQARKWKEFWQTDVSEDMPGRLSLSFWEAVDECDSDVSSVEGGDEFQNEEKGCAYEKCPYDVQSMKWWKTTTL